MESQYCANFKNFNSTDVALQALHDVRLVSQQLSLLWHDINYFVIQYLQEGM